MGRHLILIGIWLLSAMAPVNAWAGATRVPTTTLRADQGVVRIDSGIFYHFESSPLNHIQAARLAQSHWTAVERTALNFGVVAHPIWLRFDLHNSDEIAAHWFMEFKWTYLDRIEVYLFHHDTGQWEGPMLSGLSVPMAQRVVDHRSYLFPLSLQAGASATVYVRTFSSTKLIVPIQLWQKEPLRKSNIHQSLLLGIFFGILTVITLYNLLLYFQTRDGSYLFFSLFVVSLIPYMLMSTGIGARYLWDGVDWFSAHGYGVFSSLCFFTAALLIRSYLRLKQYGGWILKTNNIFIAFYAVITGMFMIHGFPLLIVIEDLAGLLGTIAGMVTSIYCWMKKDSSAPFFTLAWSVSAVTTALLILSLMGVFGSVFIFSAIQRTGFAVLVILLSFALTDRVNRERTARAEAQERALALSQKMAEERAAKLEYRQRALAYQQRISQQLETRVEVRSRELTQAMQQLEAANRQLEQLSLTDALTQLYNRRHFDQALAERTQQARQSGRPLAVALADIDHFKAINDTYGHLIGDACLKMVGQTIQAQICPQTALTARYGGEEFAVIMTAADPDEAYQMAEKIRTAVEKVVFDNRGQTINLRVSLGVAAWIPAPGEAPEKIVHAADQALYRAKQAGRNRVAMAAPPAEPKA